MLFLIISGFIYCSLVILQSLKIIPIQIEEIKINLGSGLFIIVLFGILFYCIYLMNSVTSAKAEAYYNEILEKRKEEEERLRLLIYMHKQDIQLWHTIDEGILSNINNIVEEKQNLIEYINKKYPTTRFDRSKKISKNLDKNIETLFALINHSIMITKKNQDNNLYLTIESIKFLQISLKKHFKNLKINIDKKFNFKIKININEVKKIIEEILNIFCEVFIPENDKISIKIYFSDPDKSDIYNNILNFQIKNGLVFRGIIRYKFDEKLFRILKRYNYKIRFKKNKSADLNFVVKIPKLSEKISIAFATDYGLKLTGNNELGGVLEIKKESTKFSLDLTKTEYEIIHVLIKKLHSDIIRNNYDNNLFGYLDKYKLMKKVYGNLTKQSNRLATSIYRLRKKLKSFGLNPDLFQSKHKSMRLSTSASLENIIID